MITLFTIPRAFTGKFKVIQRNAIKSWLILPAEIVVCGDEKGVKDAADEFSLVHIKEIKRNAYGTPLLSDAFQKIKSVAKFPLLAYINCDIILFPDFIAALKLVPLKQFLLIGQRKPLHIKKEIVDIKGWQSEIKKLLKKQKSKPVAGSSDYFVFPKTINFPMPPFAVGRLYWDRWLIYYARKSSIPIINATQVITAIHQQHYQSLEKHGYGEENLGKETQLNLSYIGDKSECLTVFDADYFLTPSGLRKPKLSVSRLIRRGEILLILAASQHFIFRPLLAVAKLGRQAVTWLRMNLGENTLSTGQ